MLDVIASHQDELAIFVDDDAFQQSDPIGRLQADSYGLAPTMPQEKEEGGSNAYNGDDDHQPTKPVHLTLILPARRFCVRNRTAT